MENGKLFSLSRCVFVYEVLSILSNIVLIQLTYRHYSSRKGNFSNIS